MKITIDRFEGSYAVCEREDRVLVHVERKALPPEAREGDVLVQENGLYRIDPSATQKRKARIEGLMKELWE